MKRIILFFTVCLGLSVHQTTFADNAETVRAANKRANAATAISSAITNNNRSVSSDNKRVEITQNKNTRTAVKPTQQRVVSRTPTTQNVKSRTPTNQTQQKSVVQRTATTPKTSVYNRTNNTRKSNTRSTINTGNRKSLSRAAELNSEKIESIKSADYSKCKAVYYECMDEFCANKNTDLRRCACSSRVHEFDNIKKQLSDAEDKMLDFNQRLLLVSLSKEDAAAVNVATDGELAFDTKDTSESEKLLQKITKTLNNSGDSKINNDLSAISLSLDMDSAWDNIDSLSGVSTASKNGLDLYNAARPVCIEMAKEVCSDDELTIVQDGYKLTIQQDCNTVAKSYNTQYNNAMNKIHESSALLDMSRLNIYQQRNSDDTLTCKKKILEQLSNTSVCGENLYKCLDTTGEYIDPSTGEAFLSENLYNLTNLLQEPVGEERWSKIPQNESFVKFLKSKKKFLTPAIEQCRDIADTIWNEFLDDALAQIKLAQNAKLEQVKQSCTTLVAECKTSAMTDLSAFDARALSVFNVAADKTANEMCRDVQNSCVALMNIDTGNTWADGMSGIISNVSYQAIIDTCTQVGRDCMVQKCNGASGNFALCADISSDNRMAILNRDACWNEVLNCVNSADNLSNMNIDRANYYQNSYSINNNDYSNIPTFCTDDDDIACLITEQIWGNCDKETPENVALTETNLNHILIPNTDSSLLSWFATNTNNDSCSTYGCPVNYTKDSAGNCIALKSSETTSDCQTTTQGNQIIDIIINSLTNYCETRVHDMIGNCCVDGYVNKGICVPGNDYHALQFMTTTCNSNDNYYCPDFNPNNNRQISVYCVTTNNYIDFNINSEQYECNNGYWIMFDQYGNYFDIQGQSDAPLMTYNQKCNSCPCTTLNTCTYKYTSSWEWTKSSGSCISDKVPKDNEFLIDWAQQP